MNIDTPQLRPGLTALAAILAFSSTPLLAQETDGAASEAAPVAIAPPAPVVTTPSAIAPATIMPQQLDAPAPAPAVVAPVMRTMSTPVVHTADASEIDQPAARKSASASRSATIPMRAAAPIRTKTRPETSPSLRVMPADLAAPPATAVQTARATPAKETPANTAPARQTALRGTDQLHSADSEMVPIVGAAGLGILALGGLAFAFRRRRRDDEAELDFEDAPVVAAPVLTREPMRTPIVASRAAGARLPNGFDLSRFGRHTQAAYLGPTPDNPSMSLKRRLSRASFFDQREREAATRDDARVEAAQVAPIAARNVAAAPQRDDGQVTIKLAPQRRFNPFGYVFQK